VASQLHFFLCFPMVELKLTLGGLRQDRKSTNCWSGINGEELVAAQSFVVW